MPHLFKGDFGILYPAGFWDEVLFKGHKPRKTDDIKGAENTLHTTLGAESS